MNFQENLVRARKARGLSQEDLAAAVGVSRQAVSKWETGDAAPDLGKLLALADALELSLDELCGRESPAAPPSVREETPRPKRWYRVFMALGCFLSVCLVLGTVWRWSQRDVAPAEETPMECALPEEFTVSGENFVGVENGRLTYIFTPSIAGETYTYQITFAGLGSDGAKTFDAPYSGGVCTDTVPLEPYDSYMVTVTVSNETSTRTAILAEGLSFSAGEASWLPVEE